MSKEAQLSFYFLLVLIVKAEVHKGKIMVNPDHAASVISQSALVGCEWLAANIDNRHLVILDASITPVGFNADDKIDENIPGSIFFDIEQSFSDRDSSLPHKMLEEQQFESEVRALGIEKNSLIVVYDKQGIYSSPRVWWNFKVMGHDAVYVLNGGLPEWISLGYKIEKKYSKLIGRDDDSSCFVARYQAGKVVDKFEVLNCVNKPSSKHKIIDARSQGRFFARDPEPRAGLRGGHIPKSVNIPFPEFIKDGKFVGKEPALKKFRDLDCTIEDQLVFSCGSGLTACVDILAAFECGYINLSLYDGSWTEWASDSQCPISS